MCTNVTVLLLGLLQMQITSKTKGHKYVEI